jgi:hypothetical protein
MCSLTTAHLLSTNDEVYRDPMGLDEAAPSPAFLPDRSSLPDIRYLSNNMFSSRQCIEHTPGGTSILCSENLHPAPDTSGRSVDTISRTKKRRHCHDIMTS